MIRLGYVRAACGGTLGVLEGVGDWGARGVARATDRAVYLSQQHALPTLSCGQPAPSTPLASAGRACCMIVHDSGPRCDCCGIGD